MQKTCHCNIYQSEHHKKALINESIRNFSLKVQSSGFIFLLCVMEKACLRNLIRQNRLTGQNYDTA